MLYLHTDQRVLFGNHKNTTINAHTQCINELLQEEKHQMDAALKQTQWLILRSSKCSYVFFFFVGSHLSKWYKNGRESRVSLTLFKIVNAVTATYWDVVSFYFYVIFGSVFFSFVPILISLSFCHCKLVKENNCTTAMVHKNIQIFMDVWLHEIYNFIQNSGILFNGP